jgi:hypothetical protein
MGWWMVKQPNGRLARFSDMVENFTHMNMTEIEAIDVCTAYLSLHDSMSKVDLGMQDENLQRWKVALGRIESTHGSRARSDAVEFDRFAGFS